MDKRCNRKRLWAVGLLSALSPLLLLIGTLDEADGPDGADGADGANGSGVVDVSVSIEANEVAVALALVFHDAMDGLDGCINTNAPENRNVAGFVNALDEKYPNMTRVDKWVLAGTHAVGRIILNTEEKQRLVYATGRSQSRQCSTTSRVDSEASWSHFAATFRSYGMNDAEMVALMGVHGMFAGHKNITGYSGRWVIDAPSTLSTEYYRYLRDFTYRRTFTDNRTQFRRVTEDGLNADYLMLSSEITMYYASSRDVVSSRCPKNAAFATHVERFAEDAPALERAFVTAWNKMTRASAQDN